MYHITKCSDLENEEYDIKINILVHEFLAVRKKKIRLLKSWYYFKTLHTLYINNFI